MSIAAAIRRNAVPLGQAQTSYKENVALVNTFINGVLTSKLPTLRSNPPDWQEFVDAYERANSDALQWVNTVMARLLQVPEDVTNYNPVISQLLSDAETQAEALIGDPSDQSALLALENDLKALIGQLSLVTTFISGSIRAIEGFKDVLPSLATELQTIATKSAHDAEADQQQIQELTEDVAALEAEIKSLTAAIVALGIADGVALTLGTVATIAAWPVGALAWLVMGPVVAVATTYIAIDAEKIIADKDKIKSDEESITGLTADVATLQLLTSSYAAMTAETETVEASLRAILAAWQQLESDVGIAVSDVQSAIANSSSEAFEAARKDISEAISEWDAAYAQAGELTIELDVNDAKLELGMSSEQVQQALSSGKSMEIIAYFNSIGLRQSALRVA